MTRIVAASEVGGAARLQSLALRIFGAGDRPRGWWARKLAAGRIDDGLTRVAVQGDADPRAPRSWLGYVLAGTPTDAAPFVRTSGVGVLASARGEGVAGRLLDAVAQASAAAGHAGTEVVAAPQLRGWYARHGFTPVAERWTLQTCGTSRARPLAVAPIAPPPAELDDRRVVTGSAEAWAAAADPTSFEDAVAGRLWLSRVGPDAAAWIVHGWIRRPEVPAAVAAQALRDRIPTDDALLVPLAPAVSWITANVVPAPFRVVQRGLVVRRPAPAP